MIPPAAIRWSDTLELLDQTLLPDQEVWLRVTSIEQLVEDIHRLAVRGAPAIGCAAAYGMALATKGVADPITWKSTVQFAAATLLKARPTAINLQVGIDRLTAQLLEWHPHTTEELRACQERALEVAQAFHEEDAQLCKAIGENGQTLISSGDCVLTHCNAGALATGGAGTALAVFYSAQEHGKKVRVLADETRPLLQGSRLTAWELMRAGIEVTVQCDGAAASAFQEGLINAVVVGSDRIAANGDVANKIGTYGLAVLAKEHGVPFYVAAPSTTIDFNCPCGSDIPIEERAADEVIKFGSTVVAPNSVLVRNPAFDVTPAKYVSAIITEFGVLSEISSDTLRAHISH